MDKVKSQVHRRTQSKHEERRRPRSCIPEGTKRCIFGSLMICRSTIEYRNLPKLSSSLMRKDSADRLVLGFDSGNILRWECLLEEGLGASRWIGKRIFTVIMAGMLLWVDSCEQYHIFTKSRWTIHIGLLFSSRCLHRNSSIFHSHLRFLFRHRDHRCLILFFHVRDDVEVRIVLMLGTRVGGWPLTVGGRSDVWLFRDWFDGVGSTDEEGNDS